jgi:hypothetical protein
MADSYADFLQHRDMTDGQNVRVWNIPRELVSILKFGKMMFVTRILGIVKYDYAIVWQRYQLVNRSIAAVFG